MSAARTLKDTPSAEFARLLAGGFYPIGIYPRGHRYKVGGKERTAEGKEPYGNAWGAERWSLDRWNETARKLAGSGAGIGIGLCLGPGRGPGGSWLIDIEGDGPVAEASLAKLLGGELVETMGWTSTRGRHRLFVADVPRLLALMPGLKPLEGKGDRAGVYKSPELPELELRIGGVKADGSTKQFYSACAPTLGTDGVPRAWFGPPAPAAMPDAFYTTMAGLVVEAPSKPAAAPPLREPGRTGRPSVEVRAVMYLEKCDPAVSGNRGHDKTFGVACRVGPGFDLPPDVAKRLIAEHYNGRCDPPWTDAELQHKVDDAYKNETRPRGWLRDEDRSPPGPRPGPGFGDPVEAADDTPLNLTDLGNAERLVRRYGSVLRFCHAWKKWLVYDSRRWAIDGSGAARRRAKTVVRSIYHEAGDAADSDRRKALARWAMQSEKRDAISAMLSLAEAEEGIPVALDEMDRDPWAFNVANGTIDLRTGRLRPHERADLITKMSPTAFDPAADCPLWDATLALFFDGQSDLIDYFQRICGMALSGTLRGELLPIAYGNGSNGKSTLLNTLMDVFGPDYAMKAAPDLLMAKRGDSHPTDRADLFGKRLVVAIETEQGRQLNETMVKELTGRDIIRARRMREDFWEFHPTHTLILATNHKPTVRGTDDGIWRRLKLIPFAVSVKGKAAVEDMPERLRAEAPGILAWCVRGCLRWQADGLNEPAAVAEASKEYRDQQDVLGAFFASEAVMHPAYRIKAGELYGRYKEWAAAAGETVLSMTKFGLAIEEREIRKVRSMGIQYLGVRLKTDAERTAEVEKGDAYEGDE